MFVRRNLYLSGILLLCFVLCVLIFLNVDLNPVPKYQLQNVVILSRHNLRTPLSKNLVKISPLSWPEWKEEPGHLTGKGFLLEGYMGKFFRYWLANEGILPPDCPENHDYFAYANNMQRTISSAEAFTLQLFPNCNVIIHWNKGNYDPVFSPYIHNDTEAFRNIAIKEMRVVLESLHLNDYYESIENILDYQASDICKIDKQCDMTVEHNVLNITAGKKPYLRGPLKLSNEAIDAFLMEYYSGIPLDSVAWGKLSNLSNWQSILPLTYGYHNVTFNTKHVAKDLATPLIKYIVNALIGEQFKITLLMGHDANINVILSAMQFVPFQLNNEFVLTPIGGKIVFQKWKEVYTKAYYLKIQYVYQSSEEIRNGSVLSKNHPPMFHLLQLEHCKINDDGFCPWDIFLNFFMTLFNLSIVI